MTGGGDEDAGNTIRRHPMGAFVAFGHSWLACKDAVAVAGRVQLNRDRLDPIHAVHALLVARDHNHRSRVHRREPLDQIGNCHAPIVPLATDSEDGYSRSGRAGPRRSTSRHSSNIATRLRSSQDSPLMIREMASCETPDSLASSIQVW